ncbi:MAG: DNA repair protein [Azoarcus sp.]|jgi:exonuclease SbcC|nr:DNA repair protein [Azoarcus sp.]
MIPLCLTLKGFRGIRDGLGRDELTLDIKRLAGDAELVAIAGSNGRGKTTVLDNLHPYLTMPSRAAASGAGGFSYYDQVCLAENVKDLTWLHEGRRYRSQIVIRANGRKSTEAYLHTQDEAGNWLPVELPDGVVSDGKTRTYTHCVEYLLGSADTFFTSVFSAQGKRPLSTYQNAEIKTLLADLLGQDAIQALGKKASETAGLLKAGLTAIRQQRQTLDEEEDRLSAAHTQLAGTAGDVVLRRDTRQHAQSVLEEARTRLAQCRAAFEQSRSTEARRQQLNAERQNTLLSDKRAGEAIAAQRGHLRQRLERLGQRIAARRAQAVAHRQVLMRQRFQCRDVLACERAVRHAAARQAVADAVLAARVSRVRAARERNDSLERTRAVTAHARSRLQALEREAGQAALRAEDLTCRLGLTNEVPCAGTDLQGRCKLLDDAGKARALMPSAEATIKKLAVETAQLQQEISTSGKRQIALGAAPQELARAEARESRARARVARYTSLAARMGEIEQARRRLADTENELAALAANGTESPPPETDEERAERLDIDTALDEIEARAARRREETHQALEHIDKVLAALPPPFDVRALSEAESAAIRAQERAQQAERDYLQAVRDAEALSALARQSSELAGRRKRMEERIASVEKELGNWNLLAKCLGNDGLIALAIDDAGPTLAGLANDLLLACHGSRFTVSLRTQIETNKGGQREGFDILVHDGESGQNKHIEQMSGGELVWINECLVRAVALYLAQHSGRRYGTLFSDEADGPLDPGRKRMFMAMKREVLRRGGYEREIFISQTPELTAMADAVIELADFVVPRPAKGTCMKTTDETP